MTRIQNIIRSTSHAASGFTIVEILVTVVLLAVGLLSLAGTASAVVGLQRRAARQALAASLAESRFEQLRAAHCTPPSGVDSTAGIIERWAAVSISARLWEVTERISIPADPLWGRSRTPRVVLYRSTVQC